MELIRAVELYIVAIMLSVFQQTLAAPTPPAVHAHINAVPSFVLEYAPLVWLYSEETYAPSDIGSQLLHTKPEINFTIIEGAPTALTLDNLNNLNALGGTDVYLTSSVDITTNPAWLNGVEPDRSGKTNGAASCAIIVNDHGSGEVDAFYMYFYAYNKGPLIFGQEVGDHVGDWEHNMIRFNNGTPQAMWYSQHNNGEAFTYECLEKQGKRPYSYSANGSHANYATPGTHDHTIPNLNLPWGPLEDFCDQGTLWDPVLNAYMYSYDASSNTYRSYDSSQPTNWLSYTGHWGDEQYPKSDRRQKEIWGISLTAKYVGGPTGPEDKQLNRSKICPSDGDLCIVSSVLRP